MRAGNQGQPWLEPVSSSNTLYMKRPSLLRWASFGNAYRSRVCVHRYFLLLSWLCDRAGNQAQSQRQRQHNTP